MKIGGIAGDFTGVSDTANTLHKAAAHALQFTGIPKDNVPECAAAVISLKSRSNPADEAVA
jgi:3-dehydrotetronate 4-kinase